MWKKRVKLISLFVLCSGLSIFLYDCWNAWTSEYPDKILIPSFTEGWKNSKEREANSNLASLNRIQYSYFYEKNCFAKIEYIYRTNYHHEVDVKKEEWIYYQDPQSTEFYSCNFVMYQAKPIVKYDAYLRDYATAIVSTKSLDADDPHPREISLICQEKEPIPNADIKIYLKNNELRCSDNAEATE